MNPLRIALPKGRLQDETLTAFATAGYDVPSEGDLRTRKLVFVRDGIEWIFVKDGDVPVYVEYGAADAGVAGLDQILEHESTAYQPIEFPFGHCRMMLIGAPGKPLSKIATKYPRIARRYLDSKELRAEIVPLTGSVELAAVLNLTSHVVDLVETGETVRVHRLEIQDLIAEISPRLIVGKNAYRTDSKRIRALIARMRSPGEREGNPLIRPSGTFSPLTRGEGQSRSANAPRELGEGQSRRPSPRVSGEKVAEGRMRGPGDIK